MYICPKRNTSIIVCTVRSLYALIFSIVNNCTLWVDFTLIVCIKACLSQVMQQSQTMRDHVYGWPLKCWQVAVAGGLVSAVTVGYLCWLDTGINRSISIIPWRASLSGGLNEDRFVALSCTWSVWLDEKHDRIMVYWTFYSKRRLISSIKVVTEMWNMHYICTQLNDCHHYETMSLFIHAWQSIYKHT